MTFSTTAKVLTYYICPSENDNCRLIDNLMTRYGEYFERMPRQSKQLFRAALATYVVVSPEWDALANGISCVDCCIAGAGGDDFNVWENDPELCDWITLCCDRLDESDIEGLIEAITAQLRP